MANANSTEATNPRRCLAFARSRPLELLNAGPSLREQGVTILIKPFESVGTQMVFSTDPNVDGEPTLASVTAIFSPYAVGSYALLIILDLRINHSIQMASRA